MEHATEGRLQAYLDGEMGGSERMALAAHLDVCGQCGSALEELRAHAFGFHHAVALLDRPAPTAAAYEEVVGASAEPAVLQLEAHRSWGRPARVGFLKAAMLTLVLAGAAAAAMPGSVLQRWLGSAWDRLTDREEAASTADAPPAVVEDAPIAAPAAVAPASISIEPADGAVRVVLQGAAAGARISVRFIDGPRASVTALDAPESRFRTGPGRIEALGLSNGNVVIEMPRGLLSAELEVNGRSFMVQRAGELQLDGPNAERNGDTIVFRLN